MKTRKIGALGVSELGFGCMNLATNYGPAASIDDAIKVIREAHRNGVTFFDTAEVYGPYTSETIVGVRLNFSNEVKMATKFGYNHREEERPGQPARTHQVDVGWMSEASPNRPHRSLLSTSGRSERSDRGCCRRGERAHRGREGAAFRPLGSKSQQDPESPWSSARRCASDGVFA